MMILILLILPVVLGIIAARGTASKKEKLNSLSAEDKETLETAKGKITKLQKGYGIAVKILYVIGIIITILFWTIAIIEKITFYNSVQETVGPVTIMPITSHFCFSSALSGYLSLVVLYLIVYVILRIIIQLVFTNKISKNTELSDKEKELLKLYHSKKIMPIVFWSYIIQFVSTIYRIITATADKPIIYLYPEKEEKVKVTLSNKENLIHSYPKYKDEWNVTAKPDGTLIDEDMKEYYALYYEGKYKCSLDKNIGFCVKGEDTIKFLEEKLEKLGLNAKEKEEFIVYWLPKMENNTYNYIYFKTEQEVDEVMGLDITPKPDTIIRILMCFKPLHKEIAVKEQEITTPKREGFTVVEWGGTQL